MEDPFIKDIAPALVNSYWPLLKKVGIIEIGGRCGKSAMKARLKGHLGNAGNTYRDLSDRPCKEFLGLPE